MNYKEVKDLDGLIKYLEDEKNVVYEKMTREDAKVFLYNYNYVNVITPFKYLRAEPFNYKEPGKDKFKNEQGKHVYLQPTDFHFYATKYIEERKKYPNIRNNIDIFESRFKSVASHTLLTELKRKSIEIKTIEDLHSFLHDCASRLEDDCLFGYEYTDENIDFWIEQCIGLSNTIDDLFVYFDHLSLGSWKLLYIGLPGEIKIRILLRLKELNLHLNTSTPDDFAVRFSVLRDVRNCTSHRNSLEILKRYRKFKKGTLRPYRETEKYSKMIKMLEKPDLWVDLY